LRLLAEVGELNLAADPEVQCRLTLKLKSVSWPEVLDTILRSCRLGEERLGKNLIRVAPLDKLTRELEERRRYEEQKKAAGPLKTTYRRLAYARAKEIAPLLQKFLSPRGDVAFDERTNTLIITDVVR
jgi:type IV pilus assembly protein PilQ